MFFFDDYGEIEEYQLFRRKDQPLELKHLALRQALRQAEAALRENPMDSEALAKVQKLKEDQADLEAQAPWLNLDYPLEYLLWGPPHG